MLRSLTIRNFKSIVDLTLELGRFNVFIGENGCGKSNILEALAMIAGVESDRLSNEDLVLRGMRVAKPSMLRSAFVGHPPDDLIDITASWESGAIAYHSQYHLAFEEGRWIEQTRRFLLQELLKVIEQHPQVRAAVRAEEIGDVELIRDRIFTSASESDASIKAQLETRANAQKQLRSYAIYCANTLALRGLQVQSRHEPLGIYGEGLDVAIAQLPDELRAELVEHAKMIAWLDDVEVDRDGARKLRGDKPGRSVSELYFADRFLSEECRVFSAENANEGILHVLFHLVLFLHPRAPRLFAIDNIETALNPHLLRHLVKALAVMSAAHDRQALVTTHNPAALDGLNLHDDEQRLFIVSRDDDGHTQARRVTVKPDHSVNGAKLKLSELWMRGLLGGIPTHF